MDNARKRTHVLLMPRDLIHREVLDPNDKNIAYVRDLLIDEVDWKVRFLHATHGGFLGRNEHHFLIPIEAVSYVGGGFVKTELSKEQVHGSPELDPDIRLHPELRAKIYEYYGYRTPGWERDSRIRPQLASYSPDCVELEFSEVRMHDPA